MVKLPDGSRRAETLEEKFERFVVRHEDPDACWGWIGIINPYGYGRMQYFYEKKAKYMSAHRLSYMISIGPIPDWLLVLHKCDNRACSNPKHLRLGTQKDNIDDMYAKGRQAPVSLRTKYGEQASNAILTERDVIEIRNDYATGYFTNATLSRVYGIGHCAITSIVTGKSWVCSPGPITKGRPEYVGTTKIQNKLSPTQMENIVAEYRNGGVAYSELAKKYDLTHHQVAELVRRNKTTRHASQ